MRKFLGRLFGVILILFLVVNHNSDDKTEFQIREEERHEGFARNNTQSNSSVESVEESIEVVEEAKVEDSIEAAEEVKAEESEEEYVPYGAEYFDVTENDDVFLAEGGTNIGVNSGKRYLDIFFMNIGEFLNYYHKDIDKGIIFYTKAEVFDQYGNEETVNQVIVYYSHDTLEKINFDNDNWSFSSENIYRLADGVRLGVSLKDTGSYASKVTEGDAPEDYYLLIDN